MKWLLTTEKGTEIEIDDEKISGVEIELDGKTYALSIIRK